MAPIAASAVIETELNSARSRRQALAATVKSSLLALDRLPFAPPECQEAVKREKALLTAALVALLDQMPAAAIRALPQILAIEPATGGVDT